MCVGFECFFGVVVLCDLFFELCCYVLPWGLGGYVVLAVWAVAVLWGVFHCFFLFGGVFVFCYRCLGGC